MCATVCMCVSASVCDFLGSVRLCVMLCEYVSVCLGLCKCVAFCETVCVPVCQCESAGARHCVRGCV